MTHSLVDSCVACPIDAPQRRRWGSALVLLGALLVGCTSSPESMQPVIDSMTTTSSTTTIAAAVSTTTTEPPPAVTVGAEVLADRGFDLLDGKRIGAIVNQTSLVRGEHLIDVLHAAPNLELVAACVEPPAPVI